MHFENFLIYSFKITVIAGEYQILRELRMFFHYMAFITSTLYALKNAGGTFVQCLLIVCHLMASKGIVIIRFIFARRTMKFLLAEMGQMMIATGRLGRKQFVAYFTLECIDFIWLVSFTYVLF